MTVRQETVLSVSGLRKKIGRKWIIDDVSFDIGAGEIFGFLGPNGSGKTTTIRMLVDLIRPTSGVVTVCGLDVRRHREQALRQIGSIVENPEMYPYLTGYENLEHFARMSPGADERRIAEVVDIVGLQNRIHDKVKSYSLGMRQRLGIAQALLGRPRLLILDEPTNGLDPQGIKELRAFIRKLADEGMSVFVSSHLLGEIELMCDRVAIISRGKVIAVGGVRELVRQSSDRWLLRVGDGARAQELLERQPGVRLEEPPADGDGDGLAALPGETLALRLDEAADAARLNGALVEAGVPVYALQAKRRTLEELFLGMTGGETID